MSINHFKGARHSLLRQSLCHALARIMHPSKHISDISNWAETSESNPEILILRNRQDWIEQASSHDGISSRKDRRSTHKWIGKQGLPRLWTSYRLSILMNQCR